MTEPPYDPQQITAHGPRAACEAAAEAVDADIALESATYSILEEDEDKDIWRIDAFPTSAEESSGLEATLKRFGLTVVVEKLADADWLAMALSGLPPVRAGRFFVYGAHDAGLIPTGAIALQIEAGAAFGTGHHGTTLGCLEAYEALFAASPPEKVLDVGCGTGVLAIAAARAGAKIALGTDIDEPSVRIANENAALNKAGARFVYADGLSDPQIAREAPYDLVFANILASPLIGLAPDIAKALKPAGVAILSGLLRTQADEVLEAYVGQGLRLESRIDHDAWSTLVVRQS